MKWISLAQIILLSFFIVCMASDVKSQNVADKTLLAMNTAVVPILAILVVASLILSITMFILQIKKNKKSKKENQSTNEEK